MALNVTDDQAVAIFRKKKIINPEITMNNTDGMEMFESTNQVENSSLVDCDRTEFFLSKNRDTHLEFVEN